MHNLEVYAIVILKNDGDIFFKIKFDIVLTRFNISREMTTRPLDIFMKPTHNAKTYACKILYERSSCVKRIYIYFKHLWQMQWFWTIYYGFITMTKVPKLFHDITCTDILYTVHIYRLEA